MSEIYRQPGEDVTALHDEIAMLREERAAWIEAFGTVTTIAGDMEIDIENPAGMAQKVCDYAAMLRYRADSATERNKQLLARCHEAEAELLRMTTRMQQVVAEHSAEVERLEKRKAVVCPECLGTGRNTHEREVHAADCDGFTCTCEPIIEEVDNGPCDCGTGAVISDTILDADKFHLLFEETMLKLDCAEQQRDSATERNKQLLARCHALEAKLRALIVDGEEAK